MILYPLFAGAYDIARLRNWPAKKAPPLTHWTGTVVDYPYVRSGAKVRADVLGCYLLSSVVSDHLPIITETRYEGLLF